MSDSYHGCYCVFKKQVIFLHPVGYIQFCLINSKLVLNRLLIIQEFVLHIFIFNPEAVLLTVSIKIDKQISWAKGSEFARRKKTEERERGHRPRRASSAEVSPRTLKNSPNNHRRFSTYPKSSASETVS